MKVCSLCLQTTKNDKNSVYTSYNIRNNGEFFARPRGSKSTDALTPIKSITYPIDKSCLVWYTGFMLIKSLTLLIMIISVIMMITTTSINYSKYSVVSSYSLIRKAS